MDEQTGPQIVDGPVLFRAQGLAGTNLAGGELAQLKTCEKIVIGGPEPQTGLLPNGIQSWPPNLKVLHLRNLVDLTKLPSFEDCPHLETIDITGCTGLTTLPAIEHLNLLEWLDAKDCTGLSTLPDNPPPSIQFLYLEGCTGLSHDIILKFLHELGRTQNPRLVELDLARTNIGRLSLNWPKYWEDEGIQYDHKTRWESHRWLEKIVLRDCKSLATIEDMKLHLLANLRHLDVSGCPELSELPSLPLVYAFPDHPQRVMQYLRADNSGIKIHAGMSVVKRHRKEGRDTPENHHNVAETFLALQDFGEPSTFPACRLMVLGNSMAGKTALIMRLLYGLENPDDLEGYVAPRLMNREKLKPKEGIPSTHPVHFPTWRVMVDVDGSDIPATVHIMDYGGQYKYHRSHRSLIQEGALFLLVWRHPEKKPSDDEDKTREKALHEEGDPEHTLEYWLDFILASGVVENNDPKKLQDHVVIVCTQCGANGQPTDDQKEQELGRYSALPVYHLESVYLEEPKYNQTDKEKKHQIKQFKALHQELRNRVAAAVSTNGPEVPQFFQDVAERVAYRQHCCESFRAQLPQQSPIYELFHIEKNPYEGLSFPEQQAFAFPDHEQWREFLVRTQAEGTITMVPDEAKQLADYHFSGEPGTTTIEPAHVRALTRDLHERGSLFWLRPPDRPDERYVLIDQSKAMEWIFRLLGADAAQFTEFCRKNYGRFTSANLVRSLAADEEPQRLIPEKWQEARALAMMEQHGLILRDTDSPQPSGYLATEDTLLPGYNHQHKARRYPWESGTLRRLEIAGKKDEFIGQGLFQDYRRKVFDRLRSTIKIRCFHPFQNGFQIEVSDSEDLRLHTPEEQRKWPSKFLLEVIWWPLTSGSYGGTIHIGMYADSDGDLNLLEGQLLGENGAMQDRLIGGTNERRLGETPHLLLEAESRGVPPIGISCRGTNKDGLQLYRELMQHAPPLVPFYYRGREVLEKIKDRGWHTDTVISKLCASQVMVLLIDQAYLDPPETNRYCLEELAMTLFRYDEGNWAKLEKRLRTLSVDLPDESKKLGRLYKNARNHRLAARERTLVLSYDEKSDLLGKSIKTALASWEHRLDYICGGGATSGTEPSARWLFKRELVRVLLQDEGTQAFLDEIIDTSNFCFKLDDLIEKITSLAGSLPRE